MRVISIRSVIVIMALCLAVMIALIVILPSEVIIIAFLVPSALFTCSVLAINTHIFTSPLPPEAVLSRLGFGLQREMCRGIRQF